jgi:hypothetical protein
MFDLMFGPYGAGGCTDVTGGGAKTGLSPAGLVTRALDDLLEAGLVVAETRIGAETLLWAAVHGLVVLLASGAWKDSPEDAFNRMFYLIENALGLRGPGGSGGSVPGDRI